MYFNTYGQDTYIGRIMFCPDPYQTNNKDAFYDTKCGFGAFSGDIFVLTLNSYQLSLTYNGKISTTINDIEYELYEMVIIIGTTKLIQGNNNALEKYQELEIETIERWSLSSQNNQHLLGTYSIEGTCGKGEITLLNAGNFFKFSMPNVFYGDIVSGYVINDSLFSEFTWGYYGVGVMSFSGRGKIENDSIFFDYILGDYDRYDDHKPTFENCYCKGKRIDVGILPIESNQNKVYYDATNQIIIIDETLQKEFLILELVDLLGKIVVRKTNVNNAISIANLPQGVYMYRLIEDNRVICRGKVVKNK